MVTTSLPRGGSTACLVGRVEICGLGIVGMEACWEMDATSAQSFGAAGCGNGGYLTYQKR